MCEVFGMKKHNWIPGEIIFHGSILTFSVALKADPDQGDREPLFSTLAVEVETLNDRS